MYITIKTFLTTKQVELGRKKKFVAVFFNLDNKIFIIYIAFLTNTTIHPFYTAQIALLILDKVFIVVLSKYTDFAIIFSLNLAAKLLKHTRVNNHLINLVKSS